MSRSSQLRGHKIEYTGNRWVYSDTKEIVENNLRNVCKHCGNKCTPEGYDGCIGELPGVKNACCGHGYTGEAYVQFLDDSIISGRDAKQLQRILRKAKRKGKIEYAY